MPAWENLDTFLQARDFAELATLGLQAGGTRPVTGIFDEPALDAAIGGYDRDTSAPRFLGKAADLTGVRRGDTLTIGARVFDVMSSPEIDGTGMAALRLAPRAGQGGR